jgi:thioredoxin 1
VSPYTLQRLFWALAISGMLVGIYWLVSAVIVSRARGKRLGLEAIHPGVPAILYFTTPTCVPCKTLQRPALARVQESMGDSVQVIEIDASAQPQLADYWGVLSVPTTFIIDGRGRPRRVNHGVAGAEKLERQIEEIENHAYFPRYIHAVLRKLHQMRNY